MSAPNHETQPYKPPSKSFWKGKAKAVTDDFDDLFPRITYRHLHSTTLGVRDPLRVVALCDSDAFYAACERVRLDLDPALPLVVQQWEALIAVNYPARAFGISRMDNVRDARKRCPALRVVHVATYKEGEPEPGYWPDPDTRTHKVSLDHYRRESMKIIQMFKDGLPGGEVEKASIDEAFIDFTRPVREEMLRRYPYLATVPPDAPEGLDSPLPPPPPISWGGLGSVVPVDPPKDPPTTESDGEVAKEEQGGEEPADEVGAEDEDQHSSAEEDDEHVTWHDVALSIAAEFMLRIREDIRDKLGYTTSAGLARNKFLAKVLTASYKKPMSQTILRNAAIPNYLRPMPFQKIRFLGGKLGKALAEEYDVSTVGDLLTIDLEEMQRKFGEESIWVYEILRGIDRTEVKEKSVVNKSMMASKNLATPVTKATDGHHWVRVLAAELALRLNEARDNNPALWPKTIVLHVRKGYDTSKSKQTPFPFTKSVTVDAIASFGNKLWDELVGTRGSTPFKITNVSLGFSGIGIMEAGQRTIEGFLTARNASDDQQSLAVTASDAVRSPAKRPRLSSDHEERPASRAKDSSSSRSAAAAAAATNPLNASVKQDHSRAPGSDRWAFVCDKCGAVIRVPNGERGGSDAAVDARGSSGTVDGGAGGEERMLDDAIREEMLAALRLEHADFHFAQELAAVGDVGAPKRVIRPSERPTVPTAKKRKGGQGAGAKTKATAGDGGIARFFSKR
ncbi:DNA/RNA polymerase [Epithele typhae]|uniref:DNA/RNA polymerase n=1 Tax=Epithele typhae TaxID=378194 RepID=UPI002007F30B|nr:DNA/RNA polymerase [Epithele typhae]KAH9945194.1 DNA/RNA polymerase [Epithele typhae]